MTLADQFRLTFANSPNPEDERWETSVAWNKGHFIHTLDQLMEDCIALAYDNNVEYAIRLTHMFYQELFKCRNGQGASSRAGIYFIQLAVFTGISKSLLARGRIYEVHDYLLTSFSDIPLIGQDGSINVKRIGDLERSDIVFIKNNFPDVFLAWIQSVFYYSWKVGGLRCTPFPNQK